METEGKNETISVNGVEYVRKDSIADGIVPAYGLAPDSETYPYIIGERYYIEQVTKYFTGRLIGITEKELILDQCAWIASTGRFNVAMANGNFDEVEPFPDGPVFVMRGAGIIVTPWRLILPRVTK
jgi:hypothetical protein